MTSYTLTLLDTTGIQDYIFSSNRLQENIGASELVYRATSLWAFEALHGIVGKGKHNILDHTELEWEFSDKCIENGDLDAEIIQAAGGNLLILFKEHEKAIEFTQKLTLRVLKDAPGLTLLAQHEEKFDFEKGNLGEAREELGEKMQAHKLSRIPSSPLLGLGVTAVGASTGLPAVRSSEGKQDGIELLVGDQKDKEEEKNRLISRETTFKLAARDWAGKRLKAWLKEDIGDFHFPYDLDKLGRAKGEESYIAVVHADGNHMGDHVAKATANIKDNRKWIQALRKFSEIINKASLIALQNVVSMLTYALMMDEEERIPFAVQDKKDYLPFRPLVFGGDDLTFVCSGKIGISLATMYIEEFHEAAKARGLNDLFASAGVGMVKMHYPFIRAYKLSEELANSAKSLNREEGQDCSAIDWHFAQSGLSGSLKSIREREYTVDDGKLYLRPLKLKDGEDFRSWDIVKAVIEDFQNKDKNKDEKDRWSHNKVIGLREPLRKGEKATQEYRLNFDLPQLPEIEGGLARDKGWANGRCYYFDAIELLDHYAPIKEKKEE
jgi:hypothetical protein